MDQSTSAEQIQHQIQQLQQHVDHQEQRSQKQKQYLKEEAALVRSVLTQQNSMEAKVNDLETQIQTIQTVVVRRQDSQFNKLAAMLQRGTSDLNVEASNTTVLSLLLASNERAVFTALATGKVVSEVEYRFASGSLTPAQASCDGKSS